MELDARITKLERTQSRCIRGFALVGLVVFGGLLSAVGLSSPPGEPRIVAWVSFNGGLVDANNLVKDVRGYNILQVLRTDTGTYEVSFRDRCATSGDDYAVVMGSGIEHASFNRRFPNQVQFVAKNGNNVADNAQVCAMIVTNR